MALFSECTDWYAQKLLDNADIVREAIYQQLGCGYFESVGLGLFNPVTKSQSMKAHQITSRRSRRTDCLGYRLYKQNTGVVALLAFKPYRRANVGPVACVPSLVTPRCLGLVSVTNNSYEQNFPYLNFSASGLNRRRRAPIVLTEQTCSRSTEWARCYPLHFHWKLFCYGEAAFCSASSDDLNSCSVLIGTPKAAGTEQ